MLKESGDKIEGSEKADVETEVAQAKTLLEGTPKSSELKAAHEKLTHASHKLAEVMYKASAAAAGGQAAPVTKASSTRSTSMSTRRSRARQQVGKQASQRGGQQLLSTPHLYSERWRRWMN